MAPISTRLPAVTVEYDWGIKGQRRTKHFEDANEAKTFFAKKDKDRKNPLVVKEEKLQPANDESDANTIPAKKTTAKTVTNIASAIESKDAPQKVPGVQYKRTRPYLAGTIIKNHGIEAGVTDDMVAELDELYGKPNPVESKFCLKNAWHACRAYEIK